jgi:hypothetical protein
VRSGLDIGVIGGDSGIPDAADALIKNDHERTRLPVGSLQTPTMDRWIFLVTTVRCQRGADRAAPAFPCVETRRRRIPARA